MIELRQSLFSRQNPRFKAYFQYGLDCGSCKSSFYVFWITVHLEHPIA